MGTRMPVAHPGARSRMTSRSWLGTEKRNCGVIPRQSDRVLQDRGAVHNTDHENVGQSDLTERSHGLHRSLFIRFTAHDCVWLLLQQETAGIFGGVMQNPCGCPVRQESSSVADCNIEFSRESQSADVAVSFNRHRFECMHALSVKEPVFHSHLAYNHSVARSLNSPEVEMSGQFSP